MPRIKRRRSARDRVFDAISAVRVTILIAAPFYATYDYGGVLPWTQWVLSLAAAAILLLLIPEFFGRQKRRPLTAMLVTVSLLVATLGLVQTIRLKASLTAAVSRGANFAYTDMIAPELRNEAADSDDHNLKRLAETAFPVSISPSATRAACTVPILFAIFVFAAACSFNSRERMLVLLFTLAASGSVLAFVGIADRIQPDGNLAAESKPIGEPFATFVNRNNAAAYLNLSLAAVAGCLIWRYRWQRQRRPWDDRYDISTAGLLDLISERLRRVFAYADASIILLLIGGAVILMGILVGGSRGGLLGVLAGTIVAVFRGLSRRQTVRYTLAVSVVAIALAIVLGSLGTLEQIRQRTASIWKDDFTTTARWSHWQDSITTAINYLPAGSGLGSYRYAYLPYQRGSDGKSFEHADNMYLEILVEGGLWLPLLVLSGFMVLAIAMRRLLRIHDSPTTAAIVTTSWYLLAAIGVSQMFDFAVLLPANYLTLGLLLGALVGHADNIQLQRRFTRHRIRKRSSEKSTDDDPVTETETESAVDSKSAQQGASRDVAPRKPKRHAANRFDRITERAMRPFNGRLVLPLLAITLCGFLWVVIDDAGGRARVDALERREEVLRVAGASRSLVATKLDPQLVRLEDARPTDARTQITTAKWRLLIDRSAAVRAAMDDDQLPEEAPEQAWLLADPRSRRAVFYSGEANAGDDPAKVLLPGQELARLQQARKNALRTLLANPLDVTARELLIRLDFVAPSPDADDVLFEQIAMLRRNWSPALHNAAKLAFIHPGPDTALPLWRRALVVDPQFLDIYWRDVQSYVDEGTFGRAIPDNSNLCLRFAELAQDEQVRNQLLDRALELLSKQTPGDEASAAHQYSLGRVAEMKGNLKAAQMHYESAVQGNPSLTEWRYRLVVVLEMSGRYDEARKQINRCLLQQPKNSHYVNKKRHLRDK